MMSSRIDPVVGTDDYDSVVGTGLSSNSVIGTGS